MAHKRKVSNESIQEIKLLWATKRYYQYEIAEMFGVSQGYVNAIINHGDRGNRTYKSKPRLLKLTPMRHPTKQTDDNFVYHWTPRKTVAETAAVLEPSTFIRPPTKAQLMAGR